MLQYDKMVENALKGVVKTALREVQAHGLPDNHHFYITFRTRDSGVKIPDYLMQKYESEMTIVLQFQFYNLKVTDSQFSVSLSFNNNMEDLVVPFDAITGFADPSVKFGLQFQSGDMIDDEIDADILDDLELEPADILSLAEMVEEATEEIQKSKNAKKSKSKADEQKKINKEEDKNKVVSLDQFRKK